MSTLGMVQLVYIALAIVMTGLGLSLRPAEFRRLAQQGRTVALALGLQMLVLPVVALCLNSLFQLSGSVAVGLLLLAATPGSISANLYSHLFGGKVAFNIALTGLNTILCAFTLPLVGTWAISHYLGHGKFVPILLDNALLTISIVLVPVLAGMAVATRAPVLAQRVAKPVKVMSAVIVVVFSVAAIIKEWAALSAGFAQIGAAIVSFNVISVILGFGLARAVGTPREYAITVAFQASVHNAIQAIYVALAVLGDPLMALAAGVYSITMNLIALSFGLLLTGHSRGSALRVDEVATAREH